MKMVKMHIFFVRTESEVSGIIVYNLGRILQNDSFLVARKKTHTVRHKIYHKEISNLEMYLKLHIITWSLLHIITS
jgi:hypothetical protein